MTERPVRIFAGCILVAAAGLIVLLRIKQVSTVIFRHPALEEIGYIVHLPRFLSVCDSTGDEERIFLITKRFSSFFESPQVTAFRHEYVANLSHHKRLKVYGGVMEGQSGGHPQNGFGSVFNTALNAYVIASRPEVNRVFQIFQPDSWKHAHLDEFFVDIAENSTHPIFPVLNSTEMAVFLNVSENYSIQLAVSMTPMILLRGPGRIALRYLHRQFSHVDDIFFKIKKNKEEFHKIFETKSAITRAIWNPKPTLKQLIKRLWCAALDSTGRYMGIHMRRTDKISSGETKELPVEVYYNETLRYCLTASPPCPKKVFVMSDDGGAIRKLKILAEPLFEVLDLSDLLIASGESEDAYVSCLSGSMLHALVPGTNFTRDAWHKHTREIIISVTLLAMSDHLLCTFSSNLCRLTALIRGDYSESFVHSLDIPWDPL